MSLTLKRAASLILFVVLGACSSSILPAKAVSGSTATNASVAYKTIYSFKGGADGTAPSANVVFWQGALYGTTACNIYGACKTNGGTVFRVSTSGLEQVLYRFKPYTGPNGGLVLMNGDLYGVTNGAVGFGTVFEVNAQGEQHTVYRFKGGTDGRYPVGNLLALDGELYGTTSEGGKNGDGAIFSVTPSGKESVLHSFGGSDGQGASGSLVAIGSTLYGTAPFGGSAHCRESYPYSSCGTVYAVGTDGSSFKVLYNFKGKPDGQNPFSGLTVYNGVLYGTTYIGGAACRPKVLGPCGTVFSITPQGQEHVLYRFTGSEGGAFPVAGLTVVGKLLYGTTRGVSCGGSYVVCGAMFSISDSGTLNTLHVFGGITDGANPLAGLTLADGTLYGTTTSGGSDGFGTVYELSP